MINALDVYLYDERVATITRRSGRLRFEYLPDYIRSARPVPISVQLPVVPGPFPSALVERFLDNLLPDRPDVKQRWAQEAGLTSLDAFDLLTVYGADVAGALEFIPAGVRRRREGSSLNLSDTQIAHRIQRIREDDTQWVEGGSEGHAFSLGGAQGKFALALRDGCWYEPQGIDPSTHIFKPGVKNYPGSDVTEHITLQTARVLGLNVAQSSIEFFNSERVLIVERFDRASHAGRAIRLHQEDLAQATGTSVLNKYEHHGGPSYRDIFRVFRRHLTPAQAAIAMRQFAEYFVFSWVFGNHDGHSKNFSITHTEAGSQLAPFYDSNTIFPFFQSSVVRAKDFRAFDRVELAFSINGKARIGDIGKREFQTLSRDAGLPEQHLEQFARTMAEHLSQIVNGVIASLPAELQELEVIQNIPFATYAQTLRVRQTF